MSTHNHQYIDYYLLSIIYQMLPLYLRGSNIYLVRLTYSEIISTCLSTKKHNFQYKMSSKIILSDQGFKTTLFLVKDSTNIARCHSRLDFKTHSFQPFQSFFQKGKYQLSRSAKYPDVQNIQSSLERLRANRAHLWLGYHSNSFLLHFLVIKLLFQFPAVIPRFSQRYLLRDNSQEFFLRNYSSTMILIS